MKTKILLIAVLLISSAITCFADSFTDAIQDLAVVAACKGTYSATQAGGGWYDDPHDYYTPQMLASRFAQELGSYMGIGIYGGGGIGWATDKTLPFAFENTSFAWKWMGGARVMLDKISLRGEISYMNKSDYMLGMYIGIPISNRNSQH